MRANTAPCCLTSVNAIAGACQLPGPGNLADLAEIRGSPEPGT
ncbi:unnamed protein product, partial [marine sediment metagenome]